MSEGAQMSRLLVEAQNAARSGDYLLAEKLWRQVLVIDAENLLALNFISEILFRKGELAQALLLLEKIVEVDGSDPQQFVNLALAHRGLGNELAEERALFRALCLAPNDLLALILRAELFERRGKMDQAATAYAKVIAAAPAMDRLVPNLRPTLAKAMAFKERYDREMGDFLDRRLDSLYKKFGSADLQRFQDSVGILTGRMRRFDSRPAVYYFPNLAPIEFFERKEFPWMDELESSTAAIKEELLAVMADRAEFDPYLNYPDDVEKHQFAELNKSRQWSAFHLYEEGKLVEANAAKCPQTIRALAKCSQPQQAGRTPTAMFSMLRPKTHIPAHVGVSNARLVAHLPLIVPPECRFRVGNKTREWVPGKAWVFDDSIEHEAWNNSGELRSILIFDVWHPHLSLAERALITEMASALNEFSAGDGPDFGL